MSRQLTDRVLRGFDQFFGGEPAGIVRAPGRVNLIGEHTDYNDGFALPAALGVETQVAFRERADGEVRVVALDFADGEDRFIPDAALARAPLGGWRDYVRGVMAVLARRGHAVPGLDLAISGTIARGTGLSSSASLEVALVRVVAAASGRPFDPVEGALLAQAAENDFVGMRCGVLDQLASAGAVTGTALLIDCRSLALTPVRLADDISILIVQSGITRGLTEGRYNLRRSQCEQAADVIGVPFLRDADLALLEARRHLLDDETFRRARHVVTENERTLNMAGALAADNLIEAGRLMRESHASMRDDFEITVEYTDRLVALLSDAIGAEGGARQTGGGFGGAVVALLRKSSVTQVVSQIKAQYLIASGAPVDILIEQGQAGVGILRL